MGTVNLIHEGCIIKSFDAGSFNRIPNVGETIELADDCGSDSVEYKVVDFSILIKSGYDLNIDYDVYLEQV